MKHATRFHSHAREAGRAVLGMAHAAVLSFGLLGMAQVASWGDAAAHAQFSAASVDATPMSTVGPLLAAPVQVAGVERSLIRVRGLDALAADPFAREADDLSAEMARVRDWITDTYRVSETALVPALVAAETSAQELGFDPLLIVAIMAVESSFNHRAVSNMGAQGLMQVIPRYHQDKIGPQRGKNALFDPKVNVRVGTLVLHEGLQRYGSMQRALQYYNGALEDPNARYTRKVMALKKRLMTIAGRSVGVRSAAGQAS
ncbi:transglycosylase SLT domain-containing protein [Thauera aromatica]|uniref:transglycosylase SLT domain-containing protein n=1 Tax=Thauera aromatica TaxID=59405 RepID=UPI001FFCDF2E|nr:transglycosylase SLT domain-containing protein [Thauera aromatica]MCK2097296.1 transglycosylase SLT domain-containing protein [Thauera aromatica]